MELIHLEKECAFGSTRSQRTHNKSSGQPQRLVSPYYQLRVDSQEFQDAASRIQLIEVEAT